MNEQEKAEHLISRAQDFAHRAHDAIQQRRKYTFEPYWVHTDEVAAIITEVLSDANQMAALTTSRGAVLFTPEERLHTIMAAHAHDYREDVVTKLTELGRLKELATFEAQYNQIFPAGARLIVDELTDVFVKENYPALNRRERKARENKRLATISRQGKTAKLADFISNTASIVRDDPDFAHVYIREKLNTLPLLVEGNPILFKRALNQALQAAEKLGLDIPELPAIV